VDRHLTNLTLILGRRRLRAILGQTLLPFLLPCDLVGLTTLLFLLTLVLCLLLLKLVLLLQSALVVR
jgi:hypothetical protein